MLTRTSTDQFFTDAQVDDDEVDEAWGQIEGDSFDAPVQHNDGPDPKTSAATMAFDDGGEPDFEGWLKAQALAKTKAPLPKGLSKSSHTLNDRQSAVRSTTTGQLGSGLGAKKLASTSTTSSKTVAKKSLDTKAKEPSADDDWGAWD